MEKENYSHNTYRQSTEPMEYQLGLLRNSLRQQTYPGYPEFLDRLVVDPADLNTTPDGRLVVPDGPWVVDTHSNRTDDGIAPNLSDQKELLDQGLQMDSAGRPLHPWFKEMISDPELGVVTGKGAYHNWGPNRTVDPIVIQNGHVLLIKRKDTGNWALPGGFIDGDESTTDAAVRELAEETGIVLPLSNTARTVYSGPAADLRVTANAWPETSALLFQVDSNVDLPPPQAADDAAEAAWVPIEIAQQEEGLFGSHRYLLQKAIESSN